MDDDDNKVRRNLVVASALVLGAAWLQVPLADAAEKLLGIKPDGQTLSASRLLVAVIAVLLYLGLRYRFSREARHLRRAIRRERGLIHQRRAHKMLQRLAARFSRTGKDSLVFFNELHTAANRELSGRKKHGTWKEGMHLTIKVQRNLQFEDPYKGGFWPSYSWHNGPDYMGGGDGGSLIGFQFVGFAKLFLVMSVYIELVLYSRACGQYIIPIFTWVAALLVALWKLLFPLLS